MKGRILAVAFIVALVASMGSISSAEETVDQPPFEILSHIETLTYGQPKSGGLMSRLAEIEKVYFGRELPGSLAERQQAFLNFLENGLPEQPSFIFKLGVAEWVVTQQVGEGNLKDRLEALEKLLEGDSKADGPFAMRLERIVGMILPEGISWKEIEVPKQKVFKVALKHTLSLQEVKVGDVVELTMQGDLAVDNSLVAPSGSRVLGHVESIKPPRSFGRPSEIKIAFDHIVPLDVINKIPVILGPEAEKASKADDSVVAAAGASFFGAILLGPLGFAGGMLVKGDVKDVPAGTPFYLETADVARVRAYPVPEVLQSIIRPSEVPVPQEENGSTETPKDSSEKGTKQ